MSKTFLKKGGIFMYDLMVKPVDVLGDTIMAAKDEKNVIWVGVNYFCQGLDMEKKQRDYQVEKVKADKTLKRGCRKFPAGVFDAANEVYALRLDFIPMWLAKITITKKMEENHPELADKLLEYQLKAKDILADAFTIKKGVPQTIPEQIQLLAQGNVELNQKVDTLEQRFNKFEDEMPVTGADMDDIQSAVRRKGTEVLGGKKGNAYHDKSTRTYVYADIQCELRRQFGVKRYKEIKHKDTNSALRIIEEYRLPIALKNRVETINTQQTLVL